MRVYVIILAFFIGQTYLSCKGNENSSKQQSIHIKPLTPHENKLVGNWKLTSATYLPIRLPNFSGEYADLTLTFDNNGTAEFYLNNLKDSIARYEWSADSSEIFLLNGDVHTSLSIQYLEDSLLSFSFFKVIEDTLVFRRL